MDDSHGIAAYGSTGRGTEEHCGARVDIFVGTFGKAFGVNGGFIAGSAELIEAVRQKADTYIYTNPLGAADAAAAVTAIDVADAAEGRTRLANLQARTLQFRRGLESLGFESIPGPHPVVPLLVRDTNRVRAMVAGLFERGILAVGLTFPVYQRVTRRSASRSTPRTPRTISASCSRRSMRSSLQAPSRELLLIGRKPEESPTG